MPSSVDPIRFAARARQIKQIPTVMTVIHLPLPEYHYDTSRNPMASLSLFPLPTTSLLSTTYNTCYLLPLHLTKHLLTLCLAMVLICLCLCYPLPTPVPTSTFLAMTSPKKLLPYIPTTLNPNCYDRTIPLPIPRASLSNGAPRNPMASLSLKPVPFTNIPTVNNLQHMLPTTTAPTRANYPQPQPRPSTQPTPYQPPRYFPLGPSSP